MSDELVLSTLRTLNTQQLRDKRHEHETLARNCEGSGNIWSANDNWHMAGLCDRVIAEQALASEAA